MQTPEGVPAVVFHVRTSEVKDAQGERFYGTVELDCVFTDFNMWDEVLEQLEGFALNRGDLKEEIIDVLRQKTRELEGTVQSTTQSAHTEVQHTRQALSLAQAENTRLQQRNQHLERQLADMQALADFTLDE